MKLKFWKRKPKIPNPGSQEAAWAGCICPVTANNYGNKEPKKGWTVRPACEVHGTENEGLWTR